ncbi:methyltransferase domain-containing protein [Nocardia uniformis]|uniref:Methyltransferase domain-containing protein n=1 Tax=Nocardia uniformis TaxID=53432 RepID=A0A849CCY6_9NOCA|nr:methyltransferase domain-containing protein [Nocardia uniformis]NNH75648.1 methyltransferase domain-containing protein [Nocardia uniformis]
MGHDHDHSHDDVPHYVLELEDSADSREDIPCPVCDSWRWVPLYEGVGLRGNKLKLVACSNCSHFFITPRPTLEVFERFYADDSYFHLCADFSEVSLEDKMAQFEDDAFWKKRFEHGQRLYENHLSDVLGPDDLVFDFGCGDGAWLGGLQQASGCAIDGEEISPIYAEVIRRKFGVDIFVGPAEGLIDDIVEKHRAKAKVVIVSGSLQHMLDPMRCLRAAREMLTQDGRLYICNWSIFDHFMASYGGAARRLVGEIVSWEHLHYFHELAFKYMVERAGFEILSYAPESIVRPMHMEIVAKKTTADAPAPDPEEVAAVIHRVRAFESATIADRLRIR